MMVAIITKVCVILPGKKYHHQKEIEMATATPTVSNNQIFYAVCSLFWGRIMIIQICSAELFEKLRGQKPNITITYDIVTCLGVQGNDEVLQ
jgi:hypothetical protein